MMKRTTCLWLTAILSLLMFTEHNVVAQAGGFEITQAEIRASEPPGPIQALDTRMDLHFSESSVEALHNGIPLTLVMTFETLKKGGLLWQRTIASQSWQIMLRYQPLERHYELEMPFPPFRASYVRWERLLEKLGDLHHIPVKLPIQLDHENLVHRLRIELMIESLPLPMRIQAHFSPEWHLVSRWFRCDSAA